MTSLALLVLAAASLSEVESLAQRRVAFPIGVWYEGGVGAFRHDLIPAEPAQAAPLYLRNFRDIAAHGCNLAVVPNTTPEHHRTILDAAQKAGIRLIIELGREGGELGQLIRSQDRIDPAHVQGELESRLSPVLGHPALERVQLLDEPWREIMGRYGEVARIVRSFRTADPGRKVVSAIEPFCCVIEADNASHFLAQSDSDVVAFDCYPIRTTTPIGDPLALGRFREVAVKASSDAAKVGAAAWAVIQTHAITNIHRFPTPEEVRCMTHLALAAGCKGVFWFLYQTEWWNKNKGEVMEGLVDWNYREGPRWKEVGRLAREIKALAPALLRLKPAVYRGLEGDMPTFALIGPKGELHAYVVNTDLARARTATVSLSVARADRVKPLRLPSRAEACAQVRDGVARWTVELSPGGGALFRVDTSQPD